MTVTINRKHRQHIEVELTPIAGPRFQPTGFPDLGAAEFTRPRRVNGELRWEKSVLVESAQSIANRLEAVGWDDAAQEPVQSLVGLPYVRVSAADDGRYLTSSRTESHRLASAFIKDATLDGADMKRVIKDRLDLRDDTPLAWRDIASGVFGLDPLCLLHGVFFAEKADVWPGQPRIPRAVSGFVEAIGVKPVYSGGVKRDDVRHAKGEDGGPSEGYGSIPFHRVEYTAERILASFVVDLEQIRSYGLPAPATDLLIALARWEIRGLLDGGLRFRTACDLVPVEDAVVDAGGEALGSFDELDAEVQRLVGDCQAQLDVPGPIEVVWQGGRSGKKAVKAKDAG